ncbi:MAG: hypothetical protein KGI09_04620 [Thaumarchaeota archaeon]|nr:hypothetical protein [Nitrososphaerota archaeon]
MKTPYYFIIVIVSAGIIITNNLVFADNAIPHVVIDGTISENGCNVINGIITQALDIQNTPIQACKYHGKYFKISAYLGCPLISVGDTRDPETGQKFNFNVVCDEPTTCGLKNSWGGYNLGNAGNADLLNASTINGTGYVITANYGEGVCLSEKYDEQKKKITMIADGLWKNETVLNVLVPRALLTDTTVTIDGKKADAKIEEHNPKNETTTCNLCYYTINIPLLSSQTSKKIEIGVQDTVYNNAENWNNYYMLGSFDNSFPKKPTQIFVFQYKITNGTVSEFKGQRGILSAEVHSTGNATLDIKFPRNYPYTNQPKQGPQYGDTSPIVLVDAYDLVKVQHFKPDTKTTDCFFEYSIPFSGDHKIDLAWFYLLSTSFPLHGDNIPQSCNTQTIANWPPLKQINIGMPTNEIKCDDGFDKILHPDNKTVSCVKPSTLSRLEHLGWIKPHFDPRMNPKIVLTNSSYAGIDKQDRTMVSINNQTFYQLTLEHTIDQLQSGESIKFQNVTFSFPDGLMKTISGGMTAVDIKFSDGDEEIYEKIPTRYGGTYAENDITILSNHLGPQAGLTYYKDEIKLLVGEEK